MSMLWGIFFEQEIVQYASPAFLIEADVPLYLWHVFFHRSGIHNEDGYQDPELFKLVVH
jgi:hypothetical protein